MCGITGIISKEKFSVKEELLKALKKLEYRGYDSSGFSTCNGHIIKALGEIKNLFSKTDPKLQTNCAIAHTRWATHGGVTINNAHPHVSMNNKISLVHNGIIENYEELRNDLIKKGYTFQSETDTEVIANFLEANLDKGIHDAIKLFIKKAKGTYGLVIIVKNENKIYAAKQDSPLCLGIAKDKNIIASDAYAFSELSQDVIFFEDGEFAEITPTGYEFYNLKGKVNKVIKEIKWDTKKVSKENYPHYMLKEIIEQPESVERLLKSLKGPQKNNLKKIADLVKKSKRILFLACGTSYHAGLIGSYHLSKLGYEAHAVIASEFENFSVIDKNTLIIVISQSGETMDVITVLKGIMKHNPTIVSIVNSPYSTLQRMSKVSIEIMAGQEICVGATKTFTNTLIALFQIAKELGRETDLDKIPKMIEYTLENNKKNVYEISKRLKNKRDIFVLGNKISYPVAREVSLKLKEISYKHAQGMMAGELKHGTIALIEKGVPVIGLIHDTNKTKIESALEEVEARGAEIYKIGNGCKMFDLPSHMNEEEFSICSTIIGHLLSYHIARMNKLPIDKPRNLAKSVTVK